MIVINAFMSRAFTGAAYSIIMGLCLVLHEISTLVALSISAGVCAFEFFAITRSDAKMPNEFLGTAAAIMFLPACYFWGYFGIATVVFLLFIALMVWYVSWLRARIADVAISLFGACYIGMLLCTYLIIRNQSQKCIQSLTSLGEISAGLLAGLVIFIIISSVWANDAAAYLFGSKFGKHKLSPKVSPKKTWEGLLAGEIMSMLVWCFLMIIPGLHICWWQCLLFGMVASIFGILGDLAESRFKRNSGVKDSGKLLPGHGGLLDRSDSMFLVGAVSLIMFVFFGII
ncbi:MAG: phosphatidate cytidylyltransferase [Eggerthellaceae bacterium]|nr:phosphatidate cytidylyltransferase [Eggerthellaceae bacterium]